MYDMKPVIYSESLSSLLLCNELQANLMKIPSATTLHT